MQQQSTFAEATTMADAVQYQSGSIVSRELIKRETGTITLFAFDRGQGLSEHTAPFDAFVQILEGDAQVIIGGEERRVKTGQMIVMPANVPHALNAKEPFKMMLVMIRS